MVLEDQLNGLNLSNKPKRQRFDDIKLVFNIQGNFDILEGYSRETCELVNDLNRLLELDSKTESDFFPGNEVDDEIKALVERVKPFVNSLDAEKLQTIQSQDVKSFLQTISLVLANFIVNDFIKTEIDVGLINKMTDIYMVIIETLRDLKRDTYSFLLSKTSFISPLLITISFSFKLNTGGSSMLIKTLAVLFTYLVRSESLFDSVVKMFTINPTTNIEMFQVFNKLWEKTLEIPQQNQINIRQAPGPISIINRLDSLNHCLISPQLIGHIFPYTPNQYIFQLCQSSLKAHTILSNIKTGREISSGLYELISFVGDDLSCEVLLLIIESMGLGDELLKLHGNEQYQTQLNFIFTKISQTSYVGHDNSISLEFLKTILTKDITGPLESSISQRYQVLFELVDHNYEINFHEDFAMSISTEQAIFSINRDFALQKDHLILSDLGSSLSLPALFIHVSFILSKALINFANPTKFLPKLLEESLSLKKFAPLPKSDFLDFGVSSISPCQMNLRNFQRVTNSLHMCLSVLDKIILNYSNLKSWIHPVKAVEEIENNLEYQTVDKFLEINFSAYFAVLTVSNELLQKSQSYGNNLSPVFHDLSSVSHVLKLQTFLIFDRLFQLYDNFAFYKLVKFIMKISMIDLELQKSSMKVLDHLIFHTDNGMKEAAENNDLIKKLLQQYVVLWSDGTEIYKRFEDFLGLKSNSTELVNFDTTAHLKFLGLSPPEYSNTSPSTSSSASSINNYNLSNQSNNYGLQSTLSTPNNSFVTNNNNINQPISQDNSYFGNSKVFIRTQVGLRKPNTPISAGAMDYNNYRTSNIKNVQSFVPQHFNGPASRAPSVHVDQFGQ